MPDLTAILQSKKVWLIASIAVIIFITILSFTTEERATHPQQPCMCDNPSSSSLSDHRPSQQSTQSSKGPEQQHIPSVSDTPSKHEPGPHKKESPQPLPKETSADSNEDDFDDKPTVPIHKAPECPTPSSSSSSSSSSAPSFSPSSAFFSYSRNVEPLRRPSSQINCVGGMNKMFIDKRYNEVGIDGRTCVLHNVCYDGSKILFFQGSEIPPPIEFDTNSIHESLSIPQPYLSTSHLWDPSHGPPPANFPIETRSGDIPSDAVYDKAQVHHLIDPFWPENWGHAFGDDFFRLWKGLAMFGLVTDDHQILLKRGCDFMGVPAGSERSCSYYKDLTPLVSKYEPKVLNAFYPTEENKQHSMVCMEHLVLGSSQLSMRLDRGAYWRPFLDFVLHKYDLAHLHKPKEQHIYIISKSRSSFPTQQPRRRLLNSDEIADAAREMFGVPVTVFDHVPLNLKEKIIALRQASVILTPSGGISWPAMFACPHTPVIYVDFWNPTTKKNEHLESWLWDFDPDIYDMYYPTTFEETVLENPSDSPANEFMYYRDWGSVKMNVNRGLFYLYGALKEAESAFGFEAGKSFSRKNLEQLRPISQS